MSSFASKKHPRKSILKRTERYANKNKLVKHSITISDCRPDVKETLRDEPATQTQYSCKKRKARTARATFNQIVAIRQHSEHDEDGNAIEGSAVHSEKQHCPISRKAFFQKIGSKLWKGEQISPKIIEETINENKDNSISTIDAALWLINYVEQKKSIVVEDPTKKSSLGEYNLSIEYLYIFDHIIAAINEFVTLSKDSSDDSSDFDSDEANEDKCSATTAAAAASAKRRGRRPLSNKTTLQF